MEIPARICIEEAVSRLPGPDGERAESLFRRGAVEVKLYAPRGRDPQTPHDRDEIYVVARGSGVFVREGESSLFGPGDLLFVAAGVEHHFVEFTDDLALWVLFFPASPPHAGGPERAAPAR